MIPKFSKEFGRDLSGVFEELKKLHVTGVDMESACMLTVGRLMGVKTCVLTMTTVLGEPERGSEGTGAYRRGGLLCRTALEGIYNYHIKTVK